MSNDWFTETRSACIKLQHQYNFTLGLSDLWTENTKSLCEAALECKNSAQLVECITNRLDFSADLKTRSPHFEPTFGRFQEYFNSQGVAWSTIDVEIAESSSAHSDIRTRRFGREISIPFLWHFACMHRMVQHGILKRDSRIIEVGGGYGGLARIVKKMYPQVQYTIVDLPLSILFSAIYIAHHFPQCRIGVVTEASQKDAFEGYDFVFVPVPFMSLMDGREYDTFINVGSLGEMTQASVDGYMRFLHHDIAVRNLYSINRFGQFLDGKQEWVVEGRQRGPRKSGPDGPDVSLILDRTWKLLFWSLSGEDSFSALDIMHPPYLEIVASRRDEADLRSADDRQAAQALYQKALFTNKFDSEWHRWMWESIRLGPTKKNIDLYLSVIDDLGFPEANYLRHLRDTL